MAASIAAGRWVHTFGCGHATIPVEEMYPRIGGFVGLPPDDRTAAQLLHPHRRRDGGPPVRLPRGRRGLRPEDHGELHLRPPRHDVDLLAHRDQQRQHRHRDPGQGTRHEGRRLRLGPGGRDRDRAATPRARHSSRSPTSSSTTAPRSTDASVPIKNHQRHDRARLDHGVRHTRLDDHRDRSRRSWWTRGSSSTSTRRTTCPATPRPTSGSTRRCASTSGASRESRAVHDRIAPLGTPIS